MSVLTQPRAVIFAFLEGEFCLIFSLQEGEIGDGGRGFPGLTELPPVILGGGRLARLCQSVDPLALGEAAATL